jgi:hypothetical protein
MLYAILCYDDEAAVGAWSKEEDDAVMGRLQAVMAPVEAKGRLGPVARLVPTSAATTLRKGREDIVLDGPFAETKEQLLGFFTVEADSLEEAIQFARDLAQCKPGAGAYEIRPIAYQHVSSWNR